MGGLNKDWEGGGVGGGKKFKFNKRGSDVYLVL